MPRKRRESSSDDDSYYEEPRRRNENRRGGRRNDRHDDREDDRRGNRRDDHRRDRRDDRHNDSRGHSGRSSIDSLGRPMPYKGEKIPTKVNRSCTDIICLVLFLLVLVLWVSLAGIVFYTVDVKKMIGDTVKDGRNHVCGGDENKGKNLLYIPNFKDCFKMNGLIPKIECEDPRMWCVEECPRERLDFTSENLTDEKIGKMICFESAYKSINALSEGPERIETALREIESGNCANFTYPSKKILAFCIPDLRGIERTSEKHKAEETALQKLSADVAIEAIKEIAKPDTIVQVVLDLWDSGPLILMGFGVSLILALLWMLLMRFFAGIIVWVTTLLFPVVFGGLTAFSADWSRELYNTHEDAFNFANITNLPYLMSRFEFRVAVAAVAGFLFLLTVLILIFLRKRIQIAVAVIKQASRSIASLPTLVLFPVFPFALQLASIAVGISILFTISALRSHLENDGNKVDETCKHLLRKLTENTSACQYLITALSTGYYVHIFNVFSGIWIMMFVGAFGYLVVAHAVAKYFWTRKDGGVQCIAVGSSVGTAARYHLGTIAFGSLIVSVVSTIRVILEWFQGKTKKDKNSCTNMITRCCLCCFYILEKFLKYINKNAYIMVAMYGKNFCRSAGKAFNLIVSNALRALVVTKLTDFVIFIAKVVTSACAALVLYFVIQSEACSDALEIPQLYSVFVPIVATGIGSFVVTSCFFNVYRSAVDTLFLCFLEDKKINNGTPERPYRMPSELMMIFDKKNYKRPQAGNIRKRQR